MKTLHYTQTEQVSDIRQVVTGITMDNSSEFPDLNIKQSYIVEDEDPQPSKKLDIVYDKINKELTINDIKLKGIQIQVLKGFINRAE